jgi:hypothetical protein
MDHRVVIGIGVIETLGSFIGLTCDLCDFGLRIQGGFVEVREGGVHRADASAESGATFRIALDSGSVTYSKNGTVFYTSSRPPTYPFALGAILSGATASVASVTFGGSRADESGIWRVPANAIAGEDSLVKFGGCDGCPDAGARTRTAVAAGDASAQFVFPDTIDVSIVGLASTFSVHEPGLDQLRHSRARRVRRGP